MNIGLAVQRGSRRKDVNVTQLQPLPGTLPVQLNIMKPRGRRRVLRVNSWTGQCPMLPG